MDSLGGTAKKWLFRRPYWITLAVLIPLLDAVMFFSASASATLTVGNALKLLTIFNALLVILPITLFFWLMDFVRPEAK